MDRRTFLKTLASLGAAVSLPANLALAATKEIDAAWEAASGAWDLFEVSEYGTLSYANFEEPQTRREAYWYAGPEDFDANEIERHWHLHERITDMYRDHLHEAAEARAEAVERENEALGSEYRAIEIDLDAINEEVKENWADWFAGATGQTREQINAIIDAWLDEEPDWLNEWEDLYQTGNAQGAAYDHFLRERRDLRDALGIVIIEGECPGSSYFAAELHTDVDEANRIARDKGSSIRFVREGAT
jgi:hypothetical protein